MDFSQFKDITIEGNPVVEVKMNSSVVWKKEDEYEYVDLGLPSGTLWAKCNVGAEKETDYGKYFQWGDTVGYTDASHSTWATAPFNNGSSDYDETYFAIVSDDVCPNGVLAKEYDAASANMGGNWRMPTKAECQDLIDNTTSTWTTLNGVPGRKFTSKTDSSKYIFIPAAGYFKDKLLLNRDSFGFVWSSTLNASNPNRAHHLAINSVNLGAGSNNRFCGQSVRGVRSK